MSINLVIDIGNSLTKAGLFKGKELLQEGAWNPKEENVAQAIQKFCQGSEVKYMGMVSVGKESRIASLESLKEMVASENWIKIDRSTPLPVKSRYATPATLGMDRITAVVGAWEQQETGPLLVIDSGTAITYDYMDAEGQYCGGGIGPGLWLRLRSLNDYTAALPLIDPFGPLKLVGDSTESSIRSGVVNGLLAEIDGIISKYRATFSPPPAIYLTGGDAQFLGNHLKNVNFVDSHLLLRGINAVIRYNRSHV